MKTALMLAFILALSTGSLHAQPTPKDYKESSGFRMAMGGLAVGAMGFLAGYELGSNYAKEDELFLNGPDEGYQMGSAVGALTLGLGVHLANRGRGDLGTVMLSSLLIGAAGVGITHATEAEHDATRNDRAGREIDGAR